MWHKCVTSQAELCKKSDSIPTGLVGFGWHARCNLYGQMKDSNQKADEFIDSTKGADTEEIRLLVVLLIEEIREEERDRIRLALA